MASNNFSLLYLAERGESPSSYDGQCMDLSEYVSTWLSSKGIPHRRLWIEHADLRSFKNTLDQRSAWRLSGESPYLRPCRAGEASLIFGWDFHVVVEVEGVVHDPWFGEPMPTDDYIRAQFPAQRVLVEAIDHYPSRPEAERLSTIPVVLDDAA